MKETMSLPQWKKLIEKVLDAGGTISIQQGGTEEGASFSFNVEVSSGVPIASGFQFHVNGGYINLEIPEPQFFEEVVPEETMLQLNWRYDDDKPKGYWLSIGSSQARLFFHGNTVRDVWKEMDEGVSQTK